MTSREYFDNLSTLSIKSDDYYRISLNARGNDFNISDLFTDLIKDAARCNRFSSDLYYDLCEISGSLNAYVADDDWDPVFIGFRRDGVDGTGLVLARAEEKANDMRSRGFKSTFIPDCYFALYAIEVTTVDEHEAKMLVRQYWR